MNMHAIVVMKKAQSLQAVQLQAVLVQFFSLLFCLEQNDTVYRKLDVYIRITLDVVE